MQFTFNKTCYYAAGDIMKNKMHNDVSKMIFSKFYYNMSWSNLKIRFRSKNKYDTYVKIMRFLISYLVTSRTCTRIACKVQQKLSE